MESEKVKEIKKKLQQINERELSSLAMILQFKIDVNDILTLINELESENERLKEYRKNHSKAFARIRIENTELKDRIAELEKERAELKCSLTKKTMEYELLKCGKAIGNGILEVATKTKEKLELLEFAERLKEKMNEGEYMGKKYKLSVFRDIDIDETLKEFMENRYEYDSTL